MGIRALAVLLLLVTSVVDDAAWAQPAPFARTLASRFRMVEGARADYKPQCPAGYVPAGYSIASSNSYDIYQEVSRDLIDGSTSAVNRNGSVSTSQLDGGGYSLALLNVDHHAYNVELVATCIASAISTDNTLVLVRTPVTAARQSIGTARSFCTLDYPVALGGFSNADSKNLFDWESGPVWGTTTNAIPLSDIADGQTGPPSGWQMQVFNNYFVPAEIAAFAICGKAPALQTFVYSVRPPAPAFGTKTPFTIFAPVPDGWTAVGAGFDGGPYGQYGSLDLWIQDGTVVDALQWYSSSTGYDSGSAEVRAYMIRGGGTAPNDLPARSVAAVLAVPKPASPSSRVGVVEFYNATLDHYFITAIADEITKLDNGTFAGWVRTGQVFNAYAVGSSGRTGRRPVCRAYGQPSAGLNSHFYSASPEECHAALANSNGAWGLEASEVFQMDLPDPVSGACPAADVPVYRVFNQRTDANHRYTTSLAVRDQMVARGGIAEGYGPDAVALCALP